MGKQDFADRYVLRTGVRCFIREETDAVGIRKRSIESNGPLRCQRRLQLIFHSAMTSMRRGLYLLIEDAFTCRVVFELSL